jgi:hypothetical protein
VGLVMGLPNTKADADADRGEEGILVLV